MTDLLIKRGNLEISLVVQWLSECASIAKGMGSIPGQGRAQIPVGVAPTWPINQSRESGNLNMEEDGSETS